MAREVVATVSYPGAGKSTWAKQWLAEDPANRARVSRDDLRASVFNSEGILDRDQENVVTNILNAQLTALLKAGKDVVVDATNLNHKFIKQLAAFCIKNGAVSFDTKHLIVLADVCVAQDQARFDAGGRGVGEEVIRNIAKRFPVKNWPDLHLTNQSEPSRQYVPDPGLPKTITIDIDGSIADMSGIRGPYETDKYSFDKTHPEIVELVRIYKMARFKIVFLSGRSEDFYPVTWSWLVYHIGFEPDALVMRKSGDLRNDAIIKPELFWEQVADRYQVRLHIDDRQRVVDAIRDLGIPVLQCRPGDF